jgi:predicted RNase H-like HicB family nuclease
MFRCVFAKEVGLLKGSGYNLLMTRRVLLYPGEDGFIVAEVPSLPGCISQGKTRDEALANVREAISLHEEVLLERGEPLPEDRVELVEVAA